MADLRRRVSQLVGMAERLDLRDSGRQGRVLAETVDILREMAFDVEEVSNNQLELEDYVEEIDTDLMSLEDNVYRGDDADGEHAFWEDGSQQSGSYIELECPVCKMESSYKDTLFRQEGIQLACPHCGNRLFDADEDMLVFHDDEDDVSRQR
ncbi:MAG: hypothetical protein M0Z53_15235 [Thermaerobacter sp.]|nr:hypothetical protein [Thermaerobacter sp.]